MTTNIRIREEKTNMTIHLRQETILEEELTVYIYRVGKGRNCITIIYDSSTPDNIILQGLGYYSDCTFNRKMQRRKDTSQFAKIVLSTVIHLLRKKGINIYFVYFTDKSMFSHRDIKYPLANYYFLLYAKTWYEAKFEAFPSARIHILDNYKLLLESPIKDVNLFITRSFNGEYHDRLRTIYSQNDTYLAFFNKIRENLEDGHDILCVHLKKIYETLGFSYSIFPKTDYCIDKEVFGNWPREYDITIQTIQNGGGSVKKSRKTGLVYNKYPHLEFSAEDL